MCVWFPRELISRAQDRKELQHGAGGLHVGPARGQGLWPILCGALPSNINVTCYGAHTHKIKHLSPVFPGFLPVCPVFG